MSKRNFTKLFVSVLMVATLGGCVTPTGGRKVDFTWKGDTRRVVLMPTDIELSELSAGGLEVPMADWSKAAIENFDKAVAAKLSAVNANIVKATDGLEQPEEQTQLSKLHDAVTGSMIDHFSPLSGMALPTKLETPSWTLGPNVGRLRDMYHADYALFTKIRDSYASDGRVAAIVVAVMLGGHAEGGKQRGFATLVDLNTGEVVWHNLVVRGKGDMRQYEGAKETVDTLLMGFPG